MKFLILVGVFLVGMSLKAYSQNEFKGYIVKIKNTEKFRAWLKLNPQFHQDYQKIKIPQDEVYLFSNVNENLREQEFIEYIERNEYVELFEIEKTKSPKKLNATDPKDPLFELSWGLKNLGNNEPRRKGGRIPIPGKVGADSQIFPAWSKTKGSHRVVIAVLDTGIDYLHEDLKENIWVNEKEFNGEPGVDDDQNGFIDDIRGFDFSNSDNDPMDDYKHGTHCAGIIGAQHNEVGLAGVMSTVSLMAVKFMDHQGRGTMAQAAEAIHYAVDNGAHILSNSWGALKPSKLIQEALEKAHKKQIFVVAAAGNSYSNNDKNPKYPASYDFDNIISVAAYNAENRLTGFSCWGPNSVDIAAPGRNIFSTVPNNEYAVLSGTSMAAPYVSGALGLYLSLHFNLKSNEPYDQVIEKLLNTTTPVPHLKGRIVSEGRLNIGEFLRSF